jgi:hypothetical protein
VGIFLFLLLLHLLHLCWLLLQQLSKQFLPSLMENKVGAMGGGRVWMLCMCTAAIYAAYLTQGIVQENV